MSWLRRLPVCSVASVMSDSLQPHRLQPTRILCPWDSPGKRTGVGCHSLLQVISLMQESNWSHLHFLHYRQILHHWVTREVSLITVLISLKSFPPVVVQSCAQSCVRLSVISWTAACQVSLSFTVSSRLLKLISIEFVMPPESHTINYHS